MAAQTKQNKIVHILLFFYWIVLFTATTLPGKELPKTGVNDKIEHFTAYGILSFLLYLNFVTQKRNNFFSRNAFITTLMIAAVYGIFDELHQLYVPGRSCDLFDFMADFSGAITFLIFAFFVKSKLLLSKHFT